jgi:hypothetical protein
MSDRTNSAACILILALWIAFLMVATVFAVGRI